MTTITRERLLEIIEDGFLKHGESKELARIALSSLAAEPVAYQYRLWDTECDEWGEWEDCGECAFEGFAEEEKCLGTGVQTRKLYAAPPVPDTRPSLNNGICVKGE